MNKLIIIGNLTGNPESRVVNLQSGPATVCSFTVAVNRVARNKKTTEYFRVSCWNKTAENAMKYLTKGSKVSVTGPVTATAYTAKDGTAHASMEIPAEEIEYLSSRATSAQDDSQKEKLPPPSPDDFMAIPDDVDTDLPFA